MKKTCKLCTAAFEITDDDLSFYDKISPVFAGKKYSLPPPTVCPQCRLQKKMIWRGELHLFQRTSSLSGKSMLSYFPQTADAVVYSTEEWWSDAWDPLSYGRDFDFSRPFFDQFSELIRTVPLMGLSVIGNENSDYVNSASWSKHCYLLGGANHDENCYYGNYVNHSKDCVDCSFVDHCELCYECVDCTHSYNLKYSMDCTNCSDSWFLRQCRGCKNCFGSVNVIEGQYLLFNEQLSKEEYERRLKELPLDRTSGIAKIQSMFEAHRLRFPCKFMSGEMNENVSGNVILRSRNAISCFDVSDLEDCKNCIWFHQAKNCMDCYSWAFPAEECYQCIEVGNNTHRALLCAIIYHGQNMLYCYDCQGAQDCFGCVSLKKHQYCIFNKQYTKQEYERIVPTIIEHMNKTGEWGEFFPMSLSPLAYNQSIAQDYFPVTKEQAQKFGAKWNDDPPITPPTHPEVAPDSAAEVDESICSKLLTCQETGKPYKIIPQEMKFYVTNGLPIPSVCFWVRHSRRLRKRNPRRIWHRTCAKCQKSIDTSYSPERPEIVYCEECYLEAVY